MYTTKAGWVDIQVEDVPLYLQHGELFKTVQDGVGSFSVPANVLKADLSVDTIEDLHYLLQTLRYWMCSDDVCLRPIVSFLFARSGSLDVLDATIEEYKMVFPFLQVVRIALESELVYEESVRCPLSLVQFVLRGHESSLDILMHLIQHGTVKQLLPNNFEAVKNFLDNYSVNDVAAEGDLEFLQLLYEQGIRTTSLCYYAAGSGHLSCLEYLESNGSHLKAKTSLIAATNGHLDILVFLHANQLPFDALCCRRAATHGHLPCLKYLHSIGRPWGVHVPSHAARYGHLDCLMYARENGCAWDAATCADAAEGGQLECLMYAHRNGCPWDERTTQNGIRHLPCLHYAIANGCPYSRELAEDAFKSNYDDSGFYLVDHCEGISSTIYLFAAQAGSLDIMKYCYDRNIPWHKNTCLTAASAGQKDCLKFATTNGASVVGKSVCADVDMVALELERNSFFA